MPSPPSPRRFIRATLRLVAAAVGSLVLCARLHCASPPAPAADTVDPVPETVDLTCRLPALAPSEPSNRTAYVRSQEVLVSRRMCDRCELHKDRNGAKTRG